jgi:hypothetical protein
MDESLIVCKSCSPGNDGGSFKDMQKEEKKIFKTSRQHPWLPACPLHTKLDEQNNLLTGNQITRMGKRRSLYIDLEI